MKKGKRKTRLAFADGPNKSGIEEVPAKEPFNKEAWAIRGATNLQKADDFQCRAGRLLIELGKSLLRSRIEGLSAGSLTFDMVDRKLRLARGLLGLARFRHDRQLESFIAHIMGTEPGGRPPVVLVEKAKKTIRKKGKNSSSPPG